MLSDRLLGIDVASAPTACDLFEMGSGKVGISVGEILAVFDPATSNLRYTAESPPPVLRTGDGRSLVLPRATTDFIVTLSAGMSCYFYAPGCEVPLLALHHIAQADPNRQRLEFSAHPICATMVRDALRHLADRMGLPEAESFEIVAAVGEAVANAIEHCDRSPEATFTVDCISNGPELNVHVASKGPWRVPIASDERGRGIPIMSACSRSLDISSNDDRTRVTLCFAR